MPATSSKPLRILCFGDSLTSGYHSSGRGEHPYAQALQARLEAALPGRRVHVVARGKPGDMASRQSFQQRLRTECKACSYDWVIILGGTNDLAFAILAHDIVHALAACWNAALAGGASVLGLTVLECHAISASLDANRNALNSSILTHKQPNFHALDLCSRMPYHALAEKDRNAVWDDGLHLTPAGYDLMGDHIAQGLLSILGQETPRQSRLSCCVIQ